MTEFNAYCKRMGYTEEKVRSIRYKMSLYDEFMKEYDYRKHYMATEKEFISKSITEEQKKVLLGKAMFRYVESGVETYRYKPNMQEKSQTAYFIPEREMSLDEEFIELQRVQKQLLERINHIISGPEQASLRDQMSYIVRGTEVFGKIADAMDVCFSKEPLLKMPYFLGIMEVLQVLNIAISGTDNKEVQGVDTAKVEELVSAMRPIFDLKVEMVKIPEKSMQEMSCIRNKSTLSMEEKISKVEEEYRLSDS